MKIVHICLVGAGFNDGWGYQENMLAKYNSKNGHQVSVITTQYIRDQLGKLVKIKKSNYTDKFLCNIYRLPLKKGHTPSNRFRRFSGLRTTLYKIKPDIIFVHNFQFVGILKVVEYVRNNNVNLYIDSHTDRNNSGRNWLSINILHKVIFRYFARKTLKYTNKIYYITDEVRDFLKNIYRIPDSYLEFLPLGGRVITVEKKDEFKRKVREEFKMLNDEILLCHSGKMDKRKKTLELIEQFTNTDDERFRLILIGSFGPEIKEEAELKILSDKRISFLGWKTSDELNEYIAASDLYLQPGSQSATMQSALCSGTPVLVNDTESYRILNKGNLFVIKKTSEIEEVFNNIINNPKILKSMSKSSFSVARELLDYEKLSNRYIECEDMCDDNN